MKNGQISMEYLLLIGLAMMMVIPSVYLFSERQKTYESEMISGQISQAGAAIIDNARTIYSLGKGSKTIVDVNLPKSIINITILAGREFVFKTSSQNGISDLIFTCHFCSAAGPSLNGTFMQDDALPGKKSFQIKACTNYILVERVVRNSTGDFQQTGPAYNCG